jgi:hypothetical protein
MRTIKLLNMRQIFNNFFGEETSEEEEEKIREEFQRE